MGKLDAMDAIVQTARFLEERSDLLVRLVLPWALAVLALRLTARLVLPADASLVAEMLVLTLITSVLTAGITVTATRTLLLDENGRAWNLAEGRTQGVMLWDLLLGLPFLAAAGVVEAIGLDRFDQPMPALEPDEAALVGWVGLGLLVYYAVWPRLTLILTALAVDAWMADPIGNWRATRGATLGLLLVHLGVLVPAWLGAALVTGLVTGLAASLDEGMGALTGLTLNSAMLAFLALMTALARAACFIQLVPPSGAPRPDEATR